MNSRKSLTMVLAALLIALILPVAALAQPAVSVECAYSASNLDCQVYVNTDGGQLRSGGVKLGYNAAELLGPAGTNRPVATKNGTDWFFTGTNYMDPETEADGEVVFIVGKLDLSATGVGVSGTRVPVGKVRFTRATSTLPVADPLATFGITAGFGRVAPYVNFVNVGGANLDIAPPDGDGPVEFSTKVAERCDTDGSGALSTVDLTILRAMLSANFADFPVYADCTGDGMLSTTDITVLRAKLSSR